MAPSAAGASKQLCCTHPQRPIDTPEPASRPLASIDGIFAAAALPEDHPHAFQFKDLKDKKAEFDPSIVRSPGLAGKLKEQWRRRSVRSLRTGKEGSKQGSEEGKEEGEGCDDDAQALTSREVLVEVRSEVDSERAQFGEVLGVGETRERESSRSREGLRSSVWGSVEYLRPLIEQPSMSAVAHQPCDIVDVATAVAARRVLEDIERENENDHPSPALPKSVSSPLLLPWTQGLPYDQPRRAKSELALMSSLRLPKRRSAGTSDGCHPPAFFQDASDRHAGHKQQCGVPSLRVQEPTASENSDDVFAARKTGQRAPTPAEEPHLYTMDVSQQLRSMSQLSDPANDELSVYSHNPWNFHHRERSGTGPEPSTRSRHSRFVSSLPAVDSRARSPTSGSSIYSRPTSAGANAGDAANGEAYRPPCEIPNDLNALFADWPLRPAADMDSAADDAPVAYDSERTLPTEPLESQKSSRPTSFVAAKITPNRDSIQWLSPPSINETVPKTSSSSVISGSSKKSRFLERFSPPKRLVRKRRSIFKFLRPGSRKQQARSISTPVLSVKSPSIAAYDGPSDDPALLTVQYELDDQPQHAQRSVSMNELVGRRKSTAPNQRHSDHSLQGGPTLADYERKLSIAGDDRRRPSTMSLVRLTEIQEEDRKESLGFRRQLSRAKELRDDSNSMMAQALTKHQKEKDMFRSSSKKRDAEEAHRRPTPVFSAPSFGGGAASSLAPTSEEQGESLDPLEESAPSGALHPESSGAFLSPSAAAAPSRLSSGRTSQATPSITASSMQSKGKKPARASGPPKIGTSLASWSRYPSHTRFERCGSAGQADNVKTRDFAFDFDPVNVDEDDGGSVAPDATGKPRGRKAKRLQKARSATFGNIVRYYSNLFHTSGWSGQNRRTSVALGGKLEHPELEMLSPHVEPERQHGHETLKHLKEIVREDAEKLREYVQDEEGRIGNYVRKEEGKLETFVREEEGKLEKFVDEEEDKLEGFVKKEEGKFKTFVRDEEEKHDQKHHQQDHRHHPHGKQKLGATPFRQGSIFNPPTQQHHQRRDTMAIGPNNDGSVDIADGPAPRNLDGTTDATQPLPPSGPSKAQLWSAMYQDCIVRPPSSAAQQRSESMPPSPGKGKVAKPMIRRFPSVTVVDDRKGHGRSISLISVRTGRS